MVKRSKKNQGLPPYVYKGKSSYEYKPYMGKGIKRPTIKLCPLKSKTSTVWSAWEQHQGTDTAAPYTIDWLSNLYLQSEDFQQLADDTRRNYRKCSRNLSGFKVDILDKRSAPMGTYPLSTLTRPFITKYLRARKERGAPSAGNSDIKFLNSAWEWGVNEGIIDLDNPTKGAKRNAEKPRDRYITDAEYDLILEYASRSKARYLLPVVELARLCGMRRNEILGARLSQIEDAGFLVRRLKGSRPTRVRWTDRLRTTIELCKQTHGKLIAFDDGWLIQDGHGERIKDSAFQASFGKMRKRLLRDHPDVPTFVFHDLKAKAISDSKGDKKQFGGHKSEKVAAQYDRAVDDVDSSE